MPYMKTCGHSWNVGTDDFVLPALIATAVRLIGLGFTVGVLVYLFIGPDGCTFGAEEIPPFLYGSLFSLVFILAIASINEIIIFSISVKGTIVDLNGKRKWMPFWLLIRIIIFMLEFICNLVCSVAVFGPGPYAAGALQCSEFHDGPLIFAQVVVIALFLVLLIYFLGFAIYLDPFGCCCTSSLMQDLGKVDELNEDEESGATTREEVAYATKSRIGRLHRSHLGYSRIFKKLQGLLCCLNSNGNRSRQTALQEISLALHTLFSNDNRVPADLVAGLVLLSRYQKRVVTRCACPKEIGCVCLNKELLKITFEHMPLDQKPVNYKPSPNTKFDPGSKDDRFLLDELIHYMQYSMGIYGWTLHVFDNLCCGMCQICSVTCCVCNYRCCNELTKKDEEGERRVNKDDCCMSGVGTMKLRSKVTNSDILRISYENEVFRAPYSICADRGRKTIVLTVRGTLSIKDALTDLSVSMEEIEEEYKNPFVKGKQFVHIGMYATAKIIHSEVKEFLHKVFAKKEFEDYQLVLTGHSLGAGVASVLGVIMKPHFPDLECYVFSTPGCIFSFPLSVYSKTFINSVILGNDMIPRVTYRSLLFLKRQMNNLVENCQRSKFQVIFQPRIVERLPNPLLQCMCGNEEDPEIDNAIIYGEINGKLQDRYTNADTIIKQKKIKREQTHKTLSFADAAQSLLTTRKMSKKWTNKYAGKVQKRQRLYKKDCFHSFVKGVEDGELVASFGPNKVIHINIKHSKKPWIFHLCYPDELVMRHINDDDLSVIVVDRGMVDDHLPNNVLSALKRCQKKLVGSLYNAEEMQTMREEKIARITREKAQRRAHPDQPEAAVTNQPRGWANVKENVVEVEISTL